MANKSKSQKPTDESVREARIRMEASTEHALAVVGAEKALAEKEDREQSDKQQAIANIYELTGKIKASRFHKAQSAFLELVFLKQVKDGKEYREKFGLTWEQYCDANGYNRRTLDDQLLDLKPFKADFLATFCQFFGADLHKIKYLGEAVAVNLAKIDGKKIVYKGDEYSISDVQIVLDDIHDDLRKIQEEAAATLAAKDKVLEGKQKLINDQAKTLSKFEKNAKSKGLTLEEDAFLEEMENLRIGFDGYMLRCDPVRIKFDGEPTIRMTAALIETIGYFRRQIHAAYDTATEMYGDRHDDDGFVFTPPKGKDK